jgi:hypothetical protein
MAQYERMNAPDIDTAISWLNGEALDPDGNKDWSSYTLITQSWDVDSSVVCIVQPPLAFSVQVIPSGIAEPPPPPSE